MASRAQRDLAAAAPNGAQERQTRPAPPECGRIKEELLLLRRLAMDARRYVPRPRINLLARLYHREREAFRAVVRWRAFRARPSTHARIGEMHPSTGRNFHWRLADIEQQLIDRHQAAESRLYSIAASAALESYQGERAPVPGRDYAMCCVASRAGRRPNKVAIAHREAGIAIPVLDMAEDDVEHRAAVLLADAYNVRRSLFAVYWLERDDNDGLTLADLVSRTLSLASCASVSRLAEMPAAGSA